MNRSRKCTLGAVGLALLSLQAQAADTTLTVGGNVKTVTTLSLADLRALPPSHLAVTLMSGRGPLPLDCTGPAVAQVLAKAAPDFGAVHNAFLAHTLLFSADDNYAVALSMGEIDPAYGHVTAILATDCNGKAMTAPRLVVDGDHEGGRALSGLVKIDVK